MIAYDDDLMRGVDFIHTTSQHVWGLDFVLHSSFLDVHLHHLEWVRSIWREYGCVATFSVLSEADHQFAVEFAGLSC